MERSRPGDLRDHRADAWALVPASCISKSILWTLGCRRRGFMAFDRILLYIARGSPKAWIVRGHRVSKGQAAMVRRQIINGPVVSQTTCSQIDLKKYFKAAPESLLLIARHRAKIIDSYWSRISTSLCLLRHFLQQFVFRATYSPSDTF